MGFSDIVWMDVVAYALAYKGTPEYSDSYGAD